MPRKINVTPDRKLAQLIFLLADLKNSLSDKTIQSLVVIFQHVQSNQVLVFAYRLTGEIIGEQLFVQHNVEMQEPGGEVHGLLHQLLHVEEDPLLDFLSITHPQILK
jgi:hypothetical protein